MGTRNDAADAALVAAHPWIAGASRLEIKRRLSVGSARADRLRKLAWDSSKEPRPSLIQGQRPKLDGGARVQQPPAREIYLPDSGNRHRDLPPVSEEQPWRKADPQKVMDSPTILAVPDIHLHKGQDMSRMRWLGRYVRDSLTPYDSVVFMGDTVDGKSMCRHLEEGEREGLRFRDDMEAGRQGLAEFYGELPTNPHERPNIEHVWGNHVWARMKRFVKEHPWLMGFLDDPDRWFGWSDYGVKGHKYQQPLHIRGWRFQHNLPNGGRGTVGGKYAGASMLNRLNYSESIVTAHTHKYNQHEVRTAARGAVWGITAGCYFSHYEDYAQYDGNASWDRGLVRLEYAIDGDADVAWKRIETLEAMYASEDAA